MLEESIFDFRYVRLYDVDILKEKWLNYLQTVETLIWVCIFCQLPIQGSLDYSGLMLSMLSKISADSQLEIFLLLLFFSDNRISHFI